jgi:hypothetical protein
MANVPNRFLLTNLAAKATRKLHRPNTRIVETTNDVLVWFSRANPLAAAPNTNNSQPGPRVVHTETHSFSQELEQSVA